jgi:hypothetical protein
MAKDKLEEAMEAAFAGAEGQDEQPDQETAQTEEAPEAESPEEQPEVDEAGHSEEETEVTPQARQKAPPAGTTKPGQKPTPADKGAAQEARAPNTWAPAVREEWAKLPRPVKDQILKREGDFARARQEHEQVRQGYERVQQALRPFVPHLQAAGIEPVAAMQDLFRVEYTLRSGTPAQKAETLATLIRAYGVDVEALASTLEGKPVPQQAQGNQVRDPRVDQLMAQAQQSQAQRAQQVRAQAAQDYEQFVATHEFAHDVGPLMADLMEAARKRGKPLTTEQAYEKACLLDDNVRSVMEKRKAQTARQAQHAAGSVKSQPSPPSGSRRPSMEEYLRARLNGQ